MNHRTALPGGIPVGGGSPTHGAVPRTDTVATTLVRRSRAVGRAIRDAVWARELAIAVAAYLIYFGVRGATEGDLVSARAHAAMVQDLERSLRIFVEPALQDAVLRFDWLVNVANWVYVFGHWPAIVAVFVWLYRSQPQRYRELRTAFLISGAIGLVIFALFPVAPPRLAEVGFVDTVAERSSAYRVLQPPQLTNQYAAVPSLHVGWNLLIGIALVTASSRRTLRVLGVMSPLVMFAAVVLTANHYVVDAVAGASLATAGLLIARALSRSRSRQDRTVERPAAAWELTTVAFGAPGEADLAHSALPSGLTASAARFPAGSDGWPAASARALHARRSPIDERGAEAPTRTHDVGPTRREPVELRR